jgi:hypothetical protein
MNKNELLRSDERAATVQSSNYLWAYIFITYSLLVDVAVRAAFRNEAAWDLLAIVITGGIVSAVYQAHQNTLVQSWTWKALFVLLAIAVISAVIAAVAQSYLD